mmetsp:Transcript_2738/g.5022  ORF Transcript_2738/g.5022 Transcript_2738/m.5022 type:complete len:114 (-) Transcript_2738:84-425(-)|eukprot:CAMPEP_0202499556 /NCGR_PEP_ID=MMETSP1361-20130828/30141_1 /ASSEMBLY_ACC=CAM_ASM_000849 /TAXON_ID=210615 /ORGANISM="Staurosira complex sp., Strain CCMP2646" /LENGTH=113 /DNA_ID=CAMNT_0049131775 /DNA_START=379 /DNA_END=720 /DNA_ORIENTATION=-
MEFEQHGVSQLPDDPWIDKLAMKLDVGASMIPMIWPTTILRNCFLISISMVLFKRFLDALFSALSLNDNFQASMDDLVNRFAKVSIQSEPMDEITCRFNVLRNIDYVTQLAEE